MRSQHIDAQALIRLLYKEEEIEEADAQAVYKRHRKEGIDIIEACMDAGVREDALVYAVAHLQGLEMAHLDGVELPPALIDKIPTHVANSYRIIPIGMEGDTLVIATADPDNLAALDDLKFMLKVDSVRPALTSDSAIDRALEQYYKEVEVDEAIQGMMDSYAGGDDISEVDMDAFNIDDVENMTFDTDGSDSEPVRKLLNLILLTAVKAQASDVHFEPFEGTFRVRNRIDGVLYEMLPVPPSLAGPLVARIKVMSHLDIAERRLPQDGKIAITIGGRSVDLRVSCLPTMFGESVVIRVLDRGVVSLDLDKIGMPDANLAFFREAIQKPNGIIVVTGPTGSGKTTTLYAALNEANEDTVKIITTEDPVEYEIDGLIQVPIDDSIGKTFSACLRSILRQDPDKILVGEVRDVDTAKIAIEAALTGHIVFTSLHTNDAPTAVTRLVDMGLEPFLVAATLEAIVAQRLVRTICLKCKTPYSPNEEELAMLGLQPEDVKGRQFFYGKGCEHCNESGYKGRTAVFEIVKINERIRELILERAPSSRIRGEAQRQGMSTLRESGMGKIFAGLTTIEEVVRETVDMDE